MPRRTITSETGYLISRGHKLRVITQSRARPPILDIQALDVVRFLAAVKVVEGEVCALEDDGLTLLARRVQEGHPKPDGVVGLVFLHIRDVDLGKIATISAIYLVINMLCTPDRVRCQVLDLQVELCAIGHHADIAEQHSLRRIWTRRDITIRPALATEVGMEKGGVGEVNRSERREGAG